MRAFKCDKCGKFFDDEGVSGESLNFVVGEREANVTIDIRLKYKDRDNEGRPAELCNKCIADITQELAESLTTK